MEAVFLRGDVPFTGWLADWLIDDLVAVLISMKEPVIAAQSNIPTLANTHTHTHTRQRPKKNSRFFPLCEFQIPLSQTNHPEPLNDFSFLHGDGCRRVFSGAAYGCYVRCSPATFTATLPETFFKLLLLPFPSSSTRHAEVLCSQDNLNQLFSFLNIYLTITL